MFRLSSTRWIVSASGYAIATATATRANSKPERSGVAKVKWRLAFRSTAHKTFAVPRRSYSLSRRASRPGTAGEAGRRSACSVIGFSSTQITGSCGLYGRSYTSKTSSILAIYSSSRSATTHIFFPPRLQVVAQQKNPNRFPSDARNHFAFYGFLCHQAHRPTGTTFRRTTAYHCNQTLFLTLVEHFRCAWPLSFILCPIQTALLVTTANITYSLGSERNHGGNLRCAGALRQLQQSQCTQHDPHLLYHRSTAWPALFDPSARCRCSEVDDPYLEYAPKQFYIKMLVQTI